MGDLQDKMKERWQEKRKKSYNWPKLIIMILAVVAIFYAMNRLGNTSNVISTPAAGVVDSLAADTLNTGVGK
ncbi:MAG: hypothetical protein KA984_02200 [Candidatus Cloacimonetes bacterium]|nr:hypothetical protein [Candidatus Cloacimonadota bacterium]